jgi:hypothetical protein
MSDLSGQRRELLDHFSTCAREVGVDVNPKTDSRLLDILDRLYEEYYNDRGIIIDFEPPDRLFSLDYFFKEIEKEYKLVTVLCIFVPHPGNLLGELWSLYRMWIHDGKSIAEIEAAHPTTKANDGR